MSKKIIISLLGLVSIPLFINGCAEMSQGLVNREDIAVASPNDYFEDSADRIIYTDQNWDSAESLWFYNTTQGSDLLPYDIFVNIEQDNNQKRFIDNENIEKYRYLPQKPSRDNPDGLPVGLVKDEYKGNDYVGFTCAACHTTQINYQGVGMRIDGAPALADMESMLLALEKSLFASLETNNTEKFNRLVEATGVEDKKTFSQLLTKTYKDIRFYNCANQPIHPNFKLQEKPKDYNRCHKEAEVLHYGYGRLDAVGRIYNRTLLHIGGKDENGSLLETTKTISPTAPVSYPFLWDTPQHDFVQWNGLLENNLGFIGSLARNTGEVVGVFATIDVKLKKDKIEYPSSVEVRNLVRLEDQLKGLWSPLWTELSVSNRGPLPDIKETCQAGTDICADKGEVIFKEYGCAACHQSIQRTDKNRKVVAQLSSLEIIKTDSNMARHALESCGNSGLILQEIQKSGAPTCPSDQKYSDEYDPKTAIPALTGVETLTAGVLKEGIFNNFYLTLQSIGEVFKSLFSDDQQYRHVDFERVNKGFLNAYKARPLNGIWATAPYLHNGSVPTLYDLLLPACDLAESSQTLNINSNMNRCRPNLFAVGRREFDPIKVGFVSSVTDSIHTAEGDNNPSLYIFNTGKYGNHNGGHEYAAGKDPVPPVLETGEFKKYNSDKSKVTFSQWKIKPALNREQRLNLVEYLKTL